MNPATAGKEIGQADRWRVAGGKCDAAAVSVDDCRAGEQPRQDGALYPLETARRCSATIIGASTRTQPTLDQSIDSLS